MNGDDFQLELLESQAKLSSRADEFIPIDYGNLPIDVSNQLLKQASNLKQKENELDQAD